MTFYSFAGYVTVPAMVRVPVERLQAAAGAGLATAPAGEAAWDDTGQPVDLYVLVDRGHHLSSRPQGEGIATWGHVPATLVAAHRPLDRARLPLDLAVDCWQPWPDPVDGCLVRDVVQGAQVGEVRLEGSDLVVTVALLVRRSLIPAGVLSASAAAGGEEPGGGGAGDGGGPEE